jgi:hypothetical protein
MLFDILYLLIPSGCVEPEHRRTPLRRNLVDAAGLPAMKVCPLKSTPNQPPNSSAFDTARHTRDNRAFSTIFLSIRSVDVFICNP